MRSLSSCQRQWAGIYYCQMSNVMEMKEMHTPWRKRTNSSSDTRGLGRAFSRTGIVITVFGHSHSQSQMCQCQPNIESPSARLAVKKQHPLPSQTRKRNNPSKPAFPAPCALANCAVVSPAKRRAFEIRLRVRLDITSNTQLPGL